MIIRCLRLPLAWCFSLGLAAAAADLRVGMIGLDTSHAVEFTRRLNDPADKDFIPGTRVVAAVKGGSPDIPQSWDRMPGYAKTVSEKYGVKIVDSIDDLLKLCDVVMIESIDGRPHLREALPVINAFKPLFIDKPLAGSLRDAIEIYRLAKEKNVPVFSGSCLRYSVNLQEMKNTDAGALRGAASCGPCELEPHHPDLFWYGIHPAEALYTIMGPGCDTVVCLATPDTHLVTGVWRDGKVGTLRGLRNGADPYRLTVFGSKKVLDRELDVDYTPFLRQVVKFFQTGVAPVPPAQTLEIYAFMEAADESKRHGGCPVAIADVIANNGGPLK
ncbi:MAG: Gfo/Idh/MocA family oxidoreductase [Verrucomicrobiota bacterium]